jgi:hypothetical protein
MKDVTLIIQGKVSQETLDFYIEKYPTLNVIISTWTDNTLNLSELPISYRVVTQPLPSESGFQNQNYQFVSTINGLHLATTPYIIKIRGDEYYNNIEYIYSQIIQTPEKIHCSPIFFRHWSYMKFHISDHIIAGTRENLLLMFESTKQKVDGGDIFHINDGKIHLFWEPEINLTRGYLMAVENDRFGFVDGRKLMIKHFNILDISKLEPYRIVANIFNKIWTEGFIPEQNFSISDVRKLLLENEENIYDTDIT